MKTIEVKPGRWPEFCRKVQEVAAGGLVTIEVEEANGKKETLAQDLPLRGLSFSAQAGECSNLLTLEAGQAGERLVQHVVLEPIHIRLKNGNSGERYNQIHILAENGTTRVLLHPGLTPESMRELES